MFVFRYRIRGLESSIIVVKANTREEAVKKFFNHKAGCFWMEDGSISIDEVININTLKVVE